MRSARVNLAFVVVSLGLVAVVAVVYWQPLWEQDRCLDSGGRWLAARSRCESGACIDAGTCRPSYNNTALCEALAVGTTERELILLLGQPVAQGGNELLFAPSATEPGPIRVVLDEQRKSKQFFCRGG
jgi:hypothetical protein